MAVCGIFNVIWAICWLDTPVSGGCKSPVSGTVNNTTGNVLIHKEQEAES